MKRILSAPLIVLAMAAAHASEPTEKDAIAMVEKGAAYIKQASEELMLEERLIKRDLGQLLLKLEEQQEKQAGEGAETTQQVELTETEKKAALELLRDPKLLSRITEDLGRCGLIGEATNKLTAYLAATSRKLERPLAIVVQSSASGPGQSPRRP